jgi:predicted O-linked N-acetylglucosamine transferase (SPINDLY family)
LNYKEGKNFFLVGKLVEEMKFSKAKELMLEEKNLYLSDYFYFNLLGFLEEQLGHFEDAINNYLNSIELNCNFTESKFSLANIYYKLGRLDDAKEIFLQIIKDNKKDHKPYFNLSIILFDQKLFSESLECLKVASDLHPNSYEINHQLGVLNEKLKRYDEAIKYYNIANKLNVKKDSSTLNNLGNIFGDLKDYDRAIYFFNQALKFFGDKSKIYNNLAIIYNDIGDLEKLNYCYEQSLKANPNNLVTRQRFIFNLLYSFDINQIYKEHVLNYWKKIDIEKNILPLNVKNNFLKDKIINIGIISADFRRHPVGYFLIDLLDYLKENKIKLFAYSNSDLDDDDYTKSLRKKFDYFYDISKLSNQDCAIRIYQDQIDILIDMNGYSHGNKLTIFKQKIAPVQITWAGWLASTGIKEIDYIIGDPVVTPEDEKEFYFEKIIHMPNIWCHLSTSDINQIKTSESPVLKNNYITFGCFNHMHKINKTVIEAWSKILSLVKNSKILIKNFQVNNSIYKKKIIDEFKKNNVDETRIIFESSSSRDKLLETYNNIDIALDTFPYTGGTTSFEAAWMCVPLLTLKGKGFVSRCGASINNILNQKSWIANTIDEYINLAAEYSKDSKKLDTNRFYLRSNSRNSEIFNSKNFANDFSNILRRVWIEFVNKNIK